MSDARSLLLARLSRRQSREGHRLLAESLAALSITHIYGIPGAPVDSTMGACAAVGLRVIGTRHQNGAVAMAAAHNYLSGGLHSAAIVSPGPALANCIASIMVAQENRWPVLIISGRRTDAPDGLGAFQGIDGVALTATLTKWGAAVESVSDIPQAVRDACYRAMDGQPGPVYLDIHDNALAGHTRMISAQAPDPAPGATHCTEHHIGQAVETLGAAKRPAMLIGKGARWASSWGALRRLADDHGLPFATSPMARGFLPERHPGCCTPVRALMLGEADAVLVVGARLNWTFRFGAEIAPMARIVQLDLDVPVDDPSARRADSIRLSGRIDLLLDRLLTGLDEAQSRRAVSARDPEWLPALSMARNKMLAYVEAQTLGPVSPMAPHVWLRELRTVLPESTITVLDGSLCMEAAHLMLPVQEPLTRLTPGTSGAMGVGLPFAIAAKIARPDRPVVAICGDFALGLSLAEMETAVRYRVPIIVLVANNGGNGGTQRQKIYFPPDYPEGVSEFVEDARYDLIMSAFGGLGLRVERPDELAPAFLRALRANRPTCIDVRTHRDLPMQRYW